MSLTLHLMLQPCTELLGPTGQTHHRSEDVTIPPPVGPTGWRAAYVIRIRLHPHVVSEDLPHVVVLGHHMLCYLIHSCWLCVMCPTVVCLHYLIAVYLGLYLYVDMTGICLAYRLLDFTGSLHFSLTYAFPSFWCLSPLSCASANVPLYPCTCCTTFRSVLASHPSS